MKFVYEPEVLEWMKQKRKNTILVEVVTSDSSDFEWTELHIYLIDEKRIPYLVEKKKYRVVETEHGRVLLPAYRLEYRETIIFKLKKIWIFKSITQEGIRL